MARGRPAKRSDAAKVTDVIAQALAAVHAVADKHTTPAGKPIRPAHKPAIHDLIVHGPTSVPQSENTHGQNRPQTRAASQAGRTRDALQAARRAAAGHATAADRAYAKANPAPTAIGPELRTIDKVATGGIGAGLVEGVTHPERHWQKIHPATDPRYLAALRSGDTEAAKKYAPAPVEGIIPWGVTGRVAGALRGGEKAAAAFEDAGKAVVPAGVDATEAAAGHAQQHGVDLAQVKGTGTAGKVLKGDVEKHRVQALPLAAQVQEATKGARTSYGTQKAARGQELSARSAAVDKALRTIADPDEAMAAASAAMRGELPKIDFQGFKNLDAPAMKALKSHVNQLDTLKPFQKITLNKAMTRAFEDNRVPAPHEMRLIEHVFGKQTAIGFAQHAGSWGDKVINALNIPRSIMSTFDLSAAGRQSLVAGTSHPIMWGKNFPGMIRSMKSSSHYVGELQKIKSDPVYPLALAAKVSFTDVGEHTSLAAHEEAFASDYAAQIPGLGHAIKGSARGYTAFLNKMRMDLFKNQIRIALAAGRDVHDEKFLKDIGAVVNAATGRGTIHGRAEHILPAANTLLFSPRLMLSRINYLDPSWYYRLKGPARREALRGLFATAGAVSGSLYMLSRIPGVDVGSLDPRSSDFGKLKIGNTRVDLAGGFQQYVRLASELATNASVSSTTGAKQKLGSGFGSPTRLDVIQNFAYNKLAPAAGIAVNVLRGHDAVGQKTTPQSIALNNFTPLILQDAKDVYSDKHGGMNGIAWAMGGYGIGALGVGVQTYSAGQGTAHKTVSGYEKKLKQAGVPEDAGTKALFELAGARAEARAKYPSTVHGRLQGDLDALVAAGKVTPLERAQTLSGARAMSEYALSQLLGSKGGQPGPINKLFDPTGALGRLDTAASKVSRGG